MKALTNLVLASLLWTPAAFAQGSKPSADKPFVAGGTIDVQLPGGEYDIRAAADNHIRVTLTKNPGNSKVDVATSGNSATVKITDSPVHNFAAVVELPGIANLKIHVSGGAVTIGAFTGDKDVESYGGNVTIVVPNANDYGSVDLSVKAGDIDAAPFGGSKSGLLQTFSWSGKGKYTLRAKLGAGSLALKAK